MSLALFLLLLRAVDAHRIIRNSPTVESISASTASSPSPMGDGTDVGKVTEPSSQCNDGVVCQRSEKSVFIGSYGDVDLNFHLLQVDVGRCSCPADGLPPPFSVGSLTFPGTKPKCPKKHACFPARSHVERYHLRTGPRDVAVIDSCQCAKTSERCARLTNRRVYYAGTEYETTVDHGLCLGKCGGKSCVASRNTSVAINTPNGSRRLGVISECTCKSSCYRTTHWDLFRETYRNLTTGETMVKWKKVDVGRCVGTCPRKQLCAGPSNHPLCITTSSEDGCFVRRRSKVQLETADNSKSFVTVIQDCNCQPSGLSDAAKAEAKGTAGGR
ncbi:uncharacterized protein LOC134187884 isoform X2 [Corticium candelabrum]|uniref:uncharacterized protein LOC134187884 isoform X2 n=1 Tax=Corticium candelabrum TaxID=121492 RepID=UPI002E2645A7|nr:uncharacterized protein LOC134187884 isoform X2 [Corticium candelabrum]